MKKERKNQNTPFEVRQHFRDNSERVLKTFDNVIDATQYAIDCRKFNPEGNLLVYDISEKSVIGPW